MHGDYVRIQKKGFQEGEMTVQVQPMEEESLKNADIRNRIVEYAKTLLGVKYVRRK